MKLIIQASDGLTPVIPALERLRQKDHYESEASLVYSSEFSVYKVRLWLSKIKTKGITNANEFMFKILMRSRRVPSAKAQVNSCIDIVTVSVVSLSASIGARFHCSRLLL